MVHEIETTNSTWKIEVVVTFCLHMYCVQNAAFYSACNRVKTRAVWTYCTKNPTFSMRVVYSSALGHLTYEWLTCCLGVLAA